MKKILLLIPLLFVGLLCFAIDKMFHTHGAAHLLGVPMLGNSDMRIAYSNAYRSLWKKATLNGKLDKPLGQPGGPTWLPNTGNKILSQSDLISEIVLNVNKTTYQFNINANQNVGGVQLPRERRLNLQDTFYAAQIGYYFSMVQTGGGNTDYANQLFTHPPGQFFGAINLNLADALWNGNLSLAINNRTVVPEWDLYRHRETPQTQYPQFNTPVVTDQYPINDEQYGAQSGMYPCEPMWILDGSYDNVMQVVYNNALNLAGLGTSVVHMVVVIRGILAQNCGKIMEPGLMNPE